MKKGMNKNIIAVVILFILIGLLSVLWLFFSGSLRTDSENSPKTAKIYQNGKELYAIRLDEVKESYELEIKGENGARNIILVEKGQISVKEANCPDKICVKTGPVSKGQIPITCLPNHLVIQIEEGKAEDADMTSY